MKRSTRMLTMLHFLPAGAFLRLAYLNEIGHILHLKKPRRFNEKLNALKLHSAASTWSRYVDKLEAREHVASVIGDEHLVPLIARYDSVDEIDWDALPYRFVIKCTHGSHCGIVCMDKSRFDTADAEAKLRKWMSRSWYWYGRETPYKTVQPRIMVEQFIGDDAPAQDYKLMCFGGLPRIIQVHTKRDRQATIDFFNLYGQKLAMRKKGYPSSTLESLKPSVICKLFPIARKLSADFPYVRVDLYLHNEQVYFGEMTFFDSAAFREFEPEPVNVLLGDMIPLPGQCATKTRDETTIDLSGGGILLERIHSEYAPRLSEN
ncbi:MAG: ATP-grasp fold amidoligase family protein [Clostridia bacterium]